MAAWTLLVSAACAPPDTPRALDRFLPGDVLAYLEPDSVRTVELYPHVVYHYLWSPRGPWAMHIVQASVSRRCDLGFDVLRAGAREVGGSGRERVSEMVEREGGAVLAAINADFFTVEGETVGAEIVEGRVSAAADRPAFAWRRGSAPWIGSARAEPDSLHVGWWVDRASGDGATTAVGGFPDLIDDGHRVGDLEVEARPTFAAARHPRSAIGYDVDRDRVWIVAVDGRQTPYSAGMTLPELAELFEALGADEALNLDGGGSTALVVSTAPVNRPSDPTGERAVVNALALVRTPEACTGSRATTATPPRSRGVSLPR